METIRGRLTVAYSLALTASMALFALVIYFDQHQANDRRTRTRIDEDAQSVDAYLTNQLQMALLGNRQFLLTYSTSLDNPADTTWRVSPDHWSYIESFTSSIFIADRQGKPLFISSAAYRTGLDTLVRNANLLQYTGSERSGLIIVHDTLGSPPYRYISRELRPAGSFGNDARIATILVAAQPESEAPLLFSMAIVAPLILVASAILGYWLAGRSLEPLDQMVGELEAVQDGRSLHRRIGVPAGRDELSRLATTLNAMLGRVEQSFNMLRRFTADASHELKTPLMVLRAGVERSLTHPQSPPDVVVAMDETLEQVNRMAELVANLLTLARADEGRASLVLEEHDLGPLVADVAETAELLGGEQGLKSINVDVPGAPVVIPMSQDRIRELLLNLVTNAIKYTPAGGEVTIRMRAHGKGALLEVQDTGIGIAPGDLSNIFERFWRVDQVRSREGDRAGTGLGLAICKWIAEAHGGTIHVQSRPGRGSTFTVMLPGASEDVAVLSSDR